MPSIVRHANSTDVPGILDIVNHTIATSTANYHYEPESLEAKEAWLMSKNLAGMPVIVAESEGQIVGFGTYGQFREKIGYRFTVEHSVYAHKDHQGKGIGTILMLELIRLAKVQGLHAMIAGIDSTNTESIAFHRKFGFEVVAQFKEIGYKFDRWLDVVFMQLMLE